MHSEDLPASQPTRPWALAMIWAAVAYVALLVVHLSRDSTATAAYRSGEVLPMALLSGVAIAVLAGATRRRWPWWAIALGVLGASAARVDDLPADVRRGLEVVYGEYDRGGQGRLFFQGANVAEELRSAQRESPSGALRSLGQVTVVAAGADVDLAAQLTRDFRADITQR